MTLEDWSQQCFGTRDWKSALKVLAPYSSQVRRFIDGARAQGWQLNTGGNHGQHS